MKITTPQATQVLAGLANEMRLEIFRTLIAKGGMSAGDLADTLSVGPSTLSFHLKDLRLAGLVTGKKKGRQVIYAANLSNLNDLLAFLVNDCCGGHPELCIRFSHSTATCCDKSA